MKTIIENETAERHGLPDLRDRVRHPDPAGRRAVHQPVPAPGGEAMSAAIAALRRPRPAGPRPAPRSSPRSAVSSSALGGLAVVLWKMGEPASSSRRCGRRSSPTREVWTAVPRARPRQDDPGGGASRSCSPASSAWSSAWAGCRSSLPVRWFCGVVVEFFRAVPVLLMMYFFFGGLHGQQRLRRRLQRVLRRGHRR